MKINKKKVPAQHRGLQEMLAGGENSHFKNLTLERNTILQTTVHKSFPLKEIPVKLSRFKPLL